MANAHVPAPQRPLTAEAKTSWAVKVSSSLIPPWTAFLAPSQSRGSSSAYSPPPWVLPCLRHLLHWMPRFPFATRGGPRSLLRGGAALIAVPPAKGSSSSRGASVSSTTPAVQPQAPLPEGGIQIFLRKPGSSASASTPAPTRPTPETAPGISNSAPEDATRFDAIVAQVESLTRLLTEQANKQLQ